MINKNGLEICEDKGEEFQPEYFTGLPQDRKRAKNYIGKMMEFSDDGERWAEGILESVGSRAPGESLPQHKYKRENVGWYIYCRTCAKTKTQYIEFGPGKIPAPADVEPKIDTMYYFLDIISERSYRKETWMGTKLDKLRFIFGIWLKKEHVREAVSVIRGIMGRGII